VSGLGHLLRLRDAEREGESGDVYVGGLDTSEKADDGQFAYAWHDEFMQGTLTVMMQWRSAIDHARRSFSSAKFDVIRGLLVNFGQKLVINVWT